MVDLVESQTLATDPVCGMSVDPHAAAGTLLHESKPYYFCSTSCLHRFETNPTAFVTRNSARPDAARLRPRVQPRAGKDFAKDPICGMVVDKAGALKTERAGRTYYFCSVGCQRTFESPETELKSMRTRVTIALTGVLAQPSCALARSSRWLQAPRS